MILGVCCHLPTRTSLDKTPMNTLYLPGQKVIPFYFCFGNFQIWEFHVALYDRK